MGKEHNYARRYAPTVTRNEHFRIADHFSEKFTRGYSIHCVLC